MFNRVPQYPKVRTRLLVKISILEHKAYLDPGGVLSMPSEPFGASDSGPSSEPDVDPEPTLSDLGASSELYSDSEDDGCAAPGAPSESSASKSRKSEGVSIISMPRKNCEGSRGGPIRGAAN